MTTRTQTKPLKAAKSYLDRGWSVIPIEPRGKTPLVPWKEYQTRLADENEVKGWLQRSPNCNLGIVTGAVSSLVVLDIDGPEGESHIEQQGGLPETPTVKTGKGRHIYFRHPGGRIRNFARKRPGLDLRGDGGYVVAPPSVHESGQRYDWEISPADADLADPPDWLMTLIRGASSQATIGSDLGPNACDKENRYFRAAFDDELVKLQRAVVGERNHRLNRSAFALGQLMGGGYGDRGEAERLLLDAAVSIGLGKGEANTTIKSGLDAGQAQPRSANRGPFHSTDLGNARRLVLQHGANIRFCHAWGMWLVWDSRRWAKDETNEMQRKARETVASIYGEASKLDTAITRRKMADWAKSSESRYKLEAMVNLAQAEQGVPVRPNELNADSWLLNVLNGTLDLRTGELREHQPGDLITNLVPFVYDPTATCFSWENFLKEVLPDPDLRAFVWRAVGYSLTGCTNEHCLFFAYGTGRNGKSTFFETIVSLLADYAQKMANETLMIGKRSPGAASPDLARLPGARFVVATEVEEGRRLAESLVKDLTGGDTMTARQLYRDYVDFKPTHKLWMYGNHKPVIGGTDEGIWRRVHLVPFTVTIPKHKVNKDLVQKLAGELPGILAWAIRGCLDWKKNGLQVPSAVNAATSDYRREMDELGRFLEECCTIEPNREVIKGLLFDEYVKWGGPLSKNRFGRALMGRGFGETRQSGGTRLWSGIGLLDDRSDQMPPGL